MTFVVVSRGADGKPTKMAWVRHPEKKGPPTYDEWRTEEMIRRLNKRPIA